MARPRHPRRREIPQHSRPLSYAVTGLARCEPETGNATTTWIAHVPFDFIVGQIMFPAGAYLLESKTADMFSIRLDHESSNSLVQAISIPKQNWGLSRKLLFYCWGEHYFLAQVLMGAAE